MHYGRALRASGIWDAASYHIFTNTLATFASTNDPAFLREFLEEVDA